MTSLTTVNHIDFSHVQAFGQNLWNQSCVLGGRLVTWYQDTAAPRAASVFQQIYSTFKTTPYVTNSSILLAGYCLVKPEENNTITRVIGLGLSAFAALRLYKEYTGA